MSNIKLYNDDCLKVMDELIDQGTMVDVAFTSPPYNRARNDTYEKYDDNKKDYFKFLVDFTDRLLVLTKGYVIINIQQNHYNKSEFYRYLGNYHDKIIGNIVWCKENPQPATNFNDLDNTYSVTNAYENFIVLGNAESFRSYKKNTKNYISTSVNSFHVDGHGAVMKYEVAEWFVKRFTKEGDTILDCFLGSGTTGLACRKTNRNFIGIELVKEYYDIAVKRINGEMQLNLFEKGE